ncbi:YbaB/EbfC family nucleoid-associated protein [Nocardia flavorosea]|uniref:YbaB/EbfC family nucleoid-associated protein n=1 Tax=Nocardia flavorosea TaxID=53429 RepID=UPI0018931F57|nr:YbaB/EbfC family nucleoid-associated protein [Nocardia flavorosea]MBF6351200.1 YbaB/EbfC family nucleoid-associated protein [Nocardia flavorosea]
MVITGEPARTDEMLLEQVDTLLMAFGVRRERMRELLDDLDRLRVEAVSDDGLVRVVVDADGAVVRTEVGAAALTGPSEALGAAFTEAAREAAAAARGRCAELLALLGSHVPVAGAEAALR